MKEYLKALKKEIIRDKYLILVEILIILTFFIPMNYYIEIGGGMTNIGSRVQVENAYKEKGSLNIVYVKELNATLGTYLLSYILPDWDLTKIDAYQYNSKESIKDLTTRAKLDLNKVSNTAIKNAFLEANKKIEEKSNKLIVYATYDDYQTNLKIGDEILKIDNISSNDTSKYKEYLNTKNTNDKVIVQIKRNNKIKDIEATIYTTNNENVLGISLINDINYQTNPKVKINFKKNEEGPSGGLITALKIYNQLTKEDITKGKVVAATGTLEEDGTVGEIGGIKYKVLGTKKADIFLVPKENYKEAVKVAKKHKLKVKIIGVHTFKEAINELNKELSN